MNQTNLKRHPGIGVLPLSTRWRKLPTSLLGRLLCVVVVTMCGQLTKAFAASGELTPNAYVAEGQSKGVVLLAANWGRRWKCGQYENAQLRTFGFDRIPVRKQGDEVPADLLLDGPLLLARPEFIGYAFLVEPGEYALTKFEVKAARSIRDVGSFKVGRSQLIKDDKPVLGSFDVQAGEIVYIGHFFLDCYQEPIIWRYYADGVENFKLELAAFKEKYPFLDTGKAQFRLFKTQAIGRRYDLPR
jgi:hypothetical protein